jgi:3-oxoacyl-[acyl-carrier protein] reductase
MASVAIPLSRTHMKLEGKVAIVTGGGQGIGAEMARALASEGASVAVADIALDHATSSGGGGRRA